jgi:hypothetical protein
MATARLGKILRCAQNDRGKAQGVRRKEQGDRGRIRVTGEERGMTERTSSTLEAPPLRWLTPFGWTRVCLLSRLRLRKVPLLLSP